MPLFGPLHLLLLTVILAIAALLTILCRKQMVSTRGVRLVLAYGLAVNELGWWFFRYSHEGLRFPVNLPFQLCDMTLWVSVLACLTLWRPAIELCYFAGIAGAGMALVTPDLWSPWPSYPAVYFFIAHGGIVIAAAILVYGRIAPLQPGAIWRAFGLLALYAAVIGTFNAMFGSNYMYLCRKPSSASPLDAFGRWPYYLFAGAGLTLLLFWILWIPVRPSPIAKSAAAVH